MTTPDPADARPVPDTDDLRLLAEIINNGSIGLPQAAWNARMSQPEAAARLVTMAERGLPLRLVAEGDRQLLWRIAQAGPATSGVPVAAAVSVEPPPPMESQPVQQIPVAPVVPPAGPAPDVLPPASAVPPHEQAMAGAVPLGQPPFGTPPPEDESEPEAEPQPPTEAWVEPEPEPEPAPDPTRRMLISGQWTQSVTGLFGEHLDVTLQQIIDPADQILASNGKPVEPGQRALLVQTTLGNRGPIDFEALPDLYLVIQDSAGTILQKARTTVDGYPAHHPGVAAATLVSGWTVFLVPAGTEVAQVHWSVRPDVPNRTLSWGFGPA